MRSPKSCVASLIYGVSPQPEQAPENSNNGSSNCAFLMAPRLIAVQSVSGSCKKKSQFLFSCSRNGGCACILMALCPTCFLSFTGQASIHNAHPVQSSGETCNVYFMPGNSLKRASVTLNVSGAPSNATGS